ncbi:hypothetical protein [Planktothrix phage Pra-JY27]|nr:hypothetical protein [Planktothrix phage Pag-Yong1]WEV89242.1 hypothetical protein [Synechococcus phage MinM2]
MRMLGSIVISASVAASVGMLWYQVAQPAFYTVMRAVEGLAR